MKKTVLVVILILLFQVVATTAVIEKQSDFNLAPSAVISASDTRGQAPLTVAFIGIGIDPEGEEVDYYWDFGDGVSSMSQAPVHTFMSPGTYVVLLTVEDPQGNKGTATEIIVVESFLDLPPIVTMRASEINGNAPLTVAFSAYGYDPERKRLEYNWDFDDEGSTSNIQNPVHTFNEPGSYRVAVTATDPAGNVGVASEIITVNAEQGRAPSVSMTVSEKNGRAPLTVAATAYGTDPDYQKLTYNWDFGDGTIINDRQSVVHTYYNPGTYTISVTVVDPDNNKGTDAETIIVSNDNLAPSVSMTPSERNGKVPLTIAFSAYGVDPDSDPLTYYWDFGDGTSVNNVQNPVHTFYEVGTFTVIVTVEDSHGNKGTDAETIIVMTDNLAPSVTITAEPEIGEPPLTVAFSAYGYDPEGDSLTYYWDFDDGANAAGQNVVHTFTAVNSYEVRVTVEDSHGNKGTASKTINVGPSIIEENLAPIAIASANPTSGDAPLVVAFTGVGHDIDGEIVSYYWDFGDGYSSNEQNPVHVFNYNGVFNVQLRVTDNEGATGVDIVTINVGGGGLIGTFDIQLKQGWNLISLPVRPVNTDINVVLDGVDYMSLWRRVDDHWESYLNGLGGEFSTMEADRGYWIYANRDDTITVTGSYGGSTYLNQGWNLAGYTMIYNQEIQDSLSEIDINSVWRWNADEQHWESYIDDLQNGEFTNLEPGRGYWIYVENSGTWTY